MTRRSIFTCSVAVGALTTAAVAALASSARPTAAGPAAASAQRAPVARLEARLSGIEEVPVVVTTGAGLFRASVQDGMIRYSLRYADLEGEVLQAHIHVGQPGVNGGVAIFLCSNLGNGPVGTQECPPPPAEITGLITAADVLGPQGQGVGAGELDDVLHAIRAGVTYVNVHSDKHTGGEIRGRVRVHDRGAGSADSDEGSPGNAFLDPESSLLD